MENENTLYKHYGLANENGDIISFYSSAFQHREDGIFLQESDNRHAHYQTKRGDVYIYKLLDGEIVEKSQTEIDTEAEQIERDKAMATVDAKTKAHILKDYPIEKQNKFIMLFSSYLDAKASGYQATAEEEAEIESLRDKHRWYKQVLADDDKAKADIASAESLEDIELIVAEYLA